MVSLSHYKAIILAGGKGTRLYPITYEIPKPLLPVKKKPIINYLVDLFSEQGIKEIAVLINKDFRDEFEWWKKRYYGKNKKIKLVEEKKPLGTFGGLWFLKKWLAQNPFFLTNGDELKKIDLKKMAQFHSSYPVLGTIALVGVPNPQDYGVVVCQKGIIQEFLEKPANPPTKYINSGLYLFSPEVFKYHPGPRFTMVETDLFPKLAREQKLAGFKFKGSWMDTGTFQRYEQALKRWR
jgi:NDP-sugar pyrophosphorylase family protein